MIELDLGRFLRLRNAIQQAAQAIDDDSAGKSGTALPKAYQRFRAEALDLVPQENREELGRLCPEWVKPLGGQPGGLTQAQYYHEAKVLLGVLAGFLDGYVAESQLRANAEAYAEAKIREERGVGFGGV